MKTCRKCNINKPFGDFLKNRHICRSCGRKRAREWKKNNQEHVKQYGKNYYPSYYQQNKERIKQNASAWKKKNKNKVNKMNRNYRLKYPEKAKFFSRRWKQANKDRVNASTVKRQALIKGATVGELFLREEVYIRDNGICHICKLPVSIEDYQIDHIIPVSKGGPHTKNNVATSHARCNQQKGNRLQNALV